MRLIIFRGKNREQSTTHTTRIITLQWKLSIMEVKEKSVTENQEETNKNNTESRIARKKKYIYFY